MKKLWDSLSNSQRISIIAVAVLTVAGLYAFSQWRHESDFRPLYTSMAPEDAAAVVQKLRESGVEYRLADNGATVLVPSAKQAESRLTLAAAGLPKTGRIGFELFDKSNFGATEFVEHINYQRALEGELERSVMSLAEVEQARVHITMAKDSVFLEQQQPAKASIMVKLRPHAQISPQNVIAITNLVASAVEGLAPESVSVVDMNGNLLSRPRRLGGPDGSQSTAEALELRQQFEKDLVTKIRATLEPVLGPDRFRAGASVDIDLTSGDQQEETFDPTKSVMLSSQKTEDVVDRGISAGIPGTASNLPRGNSTPSAGGSGSARRSENATFQSSRIVRHTRIPQGMIKRMSLSVLLDQTAHWEGQGAARHRVLEPPKPETVQSIKGLLTAATGLNTERGDQLIIESLPFETTLNPEMPPGGEPSKAAPKFSGPKWLQLLNQYKDLIGPISAGIIAIVLLLFAIFRFMGPKRRLETDSAQQLEAGSRPSELEANLPAGQLAAASQPLGDDELEITERVRQLAKRDVSTAANVVRLWLQDNKS
ncbi:MAG TPA: flagellar basal-body MS-ring/collar protein FliF [Bryobacteraceae bacterium]|nr:flagellar basal-body MS-ring/collar protein FliF [Bryobacteraceae bacterium]